MAQAAKDNNMWQPFSAYLSTFKVLNQMMRGATEDLRAVVLETIQRSTNLHDLEKRAADLFNKSTMDIFPIESGEWPSGHRRLWTRAVLADPANLDLITHAVSERGPEEIQFLRTHAAPLAVLLSAAETRPAAQAFLRMFNPKPSTRPFLCGAALSRRHFSGITWTPSITHCAKKD